MVNATLRMETASQETRREWRKHDNKRQEVDYYQPEEETISKPNKMLNDGKSTNQNLSTDKGFKMERRFLKTHHYTYFVQVY